jgi:AcrR family transcriptional regulator
MSKPTKAARKGRPSRAYHHGDLKAALVTHAIELLRAEGLEALTLRGVARAAGVSQAAPYRHFADKRELIGAVAEDGFRRLQASMIERMSGKEGRTGFKGVALAYIDFALQNPAEYRVMFGPEVANTEDLPSLRGTSRSVLGFVAQGIEQLQQAGLIGPGNPMSMAVATWAMLHGLVMLWLDGAAQGVAPPLPELVDEVTRIMMFGMAGSRPA